MRRIVLSVAGLLALAACGGGGNPWQVEHKPGLWRQTYSEGSQAGSIIAICYAPGHQLTLVHDEQLAQLPNGTCEPAQRTVVPGGWVSTQKCTVQNTHVTIRYVAQGDRATDIQGRLTVTTDAGAPAGGAQALRIQRMGDCPADWKPADYIRLDTPPDAEGWQLVHPGDNGAPDTFTRLPTLPPQIEALRH